MSYVLKAPIILIPTPTFNQEVLTRRCVGVRRPFKMSGKSASYDTLLLFRNVKADGADKSTDRRVNNEADSFAELGRLTDLNF